MTNNICNCDEFKKVLKFGIGEEVYIAQFIPVEDDRKWTIGTQETPVKFCPWCGAELERQGTAESW